MSFVIPVHNRVATLADAVQSALEQDDVELEVVVVDDGSADDPASVLPNDERVTMLTTTHGGVSRARNVGVDASRGRVIVFLDADDTISDSRRARDQLALLDPQPELAFVHSGWEVIDQHGQLLATRTPWTRGSRLDLDTVMLYPAVLPSAMAFRAACVQAVGGFDESLDHLEDLDLVTRLLLRGWTATWLERITTRYRRHDANASSNIDAQRDALAVVLDRVFSDPNVTSSVAALERRVRHGTHVWLASRYQQAGATDRMAEHLAESAVWADGPVSRLPLDWVQGFVDARADAGDPRLDVFALTSDPSWQTAVRLRATALLERGATTGGSSVSRAANPPSPPAVANVWRDAAPPDQLPAPVLDLSDARGRDYGRHRSGWALAIEALAPLHVDGGVRLDAFVEHTFYGPAMAYTSPWVGFLHNPADLPPWYPIDQSAGQLLRDARFQASLATCRGLFTLSTELREWWAARVDVPVVAVPYPTGQPELRFDIDSMKHNPVPRIVQVGTWLRKLHAVHQLPVRGLRRTIVHQHEHYIDGLFAAERRALQLHVDDSCVETLPFLDHRAYDELLSCNLVFVELYAASATNVVVECMARATPILVNPLPAVREYLGDDYPLYFSSRTEAARKAEDLALVATAHDYLAGLPQGAQLGDACFVGAVSRSAIYRALAS